jgi:glycosyltransferase involved in cell wall biosynthesis
MVKETSNTTEKESHCMSLSVVIITKNEERHIAQCIDSLLAATTDLPDTEILLVDSISTDRTIEIAKQYPIKIIILDPTLFLSPSAGRYVGFQHTVGDTVFFLDADMTVDPDWFRHGLAALEADPKLGAIAGRRHELQFDTDYKLTGETEDPFEEGETSHRVHYFGQCALYRRSVLEEVGGFNPYLANEEELELGFRISQAGYRMERLVTPMTTHHTQYYTAATPSHLTWLQIRRDWAFKRFQGLGHVLRLLVGNPLIREFMVAYKRALVFMGLLAAGAISALASILVSSAFPILLWVFTMLALFLLRVIVKRSVSDTVRFTSYYFSCAYGFVVGFITPPPPADTYRPDITVIDNLAKE